MYGAARNEQAWLRTGLCPLRVVRLAARGIWSCGRWGCGNFPAKGSEIHGRAEGADLRAAPSAESGALVYGNSRLRMLSPPGARSVGAAARLPLRHHRATLQPHRRAVAGSFEKDLKGQMQPALRPFNENNPLAHTQSYPAGHTVYARKLSPVPVEGARRWHLREPLGAILCDRMSRQWWSLSLLYTKDT